MCCKKSMGGTTLNKWDKLFNSLKDQIDPWLDTNSLYFKIENSVFKNLKLDPGKMIPNYSKKEIPPILVKHNLELLRSGKGTCILTKTGQNRNLSSLFPEFPIIESQYQGPPFAPISPDSVLVQPKLINEESGLHLADRTGIINAFLVETISPYQIFSNSGRLRTNVEGEVWLGHEKVKISSTQMECDAILESEHSIVAVEVKRGLQKSFSIHQLVFPLLLIQKHIPNKKAYGLFMQFESEPKWIFQLYLLDISVSEDCYYITSYQYLRSKEYHLEQTQNLLK